MKSAKEFLEQSTVSKFQHYDDILGKYIYEDEVIEVMKEYRESVFEEIKKIIEDELENIDEDDPQYDGLDRAEILVSSLQINFRYKL